MQVVEHPRGKPRTRKRRAVAISLVVARRPHRRRRVLVDSPVAKPPARVAPPVPVTIVTAESRDVPIYLDALGTVAASNTVAIHSQITGTLQAVNFTEGQEVHRATRSR